MPPAVYAVCKDAPLGNVLEPAVLALSNLTLVRLEQPLKARFPMLATPLPMVTLVRLLQPKKVVLAMLVTLLGMIMLVRLVQAK